MNDTMTDLDMLEERARIDQRPKVNKLETLSAKPPRRTRSDKGVKKGPKVQEKVETGVLTVEQRNRAGALMMELEGAHSRLYTATEAYQKAHAAFHDYLDSLTAK